MTEEIDSSSTVAAVIVCYHPSLEHIRCLLDCLAGQVQRCFIVDNGVDDELAAVLHDRGCENELLIRMSGNEGIGAAQNAGIRAAKSLGVDYILLLDHDSLPLPDMVLELLRACRFLAARGIAVAAVGPTYVDERQANTSVFVKARAGRLQRVSPPEGEGIVEVDHLIASGSLIPSASLDAVGLMDESLFIDYVDVEWCLRAAHLGFRSFGSSLAHMKHSLGDVPIQVMGRTYPSRSPLRHYYSFRNAVILTLMRNIPAGWKFANGVAMLVKLVFYSIFGQNRFAQICMMCLGILHGLIGRRGALPVSR